MRTQRPISRQGIASPRRNRRALLSQVGTGTGWIVMLFVVLVISPGASASQIFGARMVLGDAHLTDTGILLEDSAEPGSVTSHVSPLRDTQGVHPGLSPVAAPERPAARALIKRLHTAPPGSKSRYKRSKFGPAWTDQAEHVIWGHNACDTRDDILRRDLAGVTFRAGTHNCVVLSGTLKDPYTGKQISFTKKQASQVQIDHIFPLALAWEMGASVWPTPMLIRFAETPLNLLAVDGKANGKKQDSGPAEWLPANASVRCAYSVRFAEVALEYKLNVTPEDKKVMLHQCAS